MATSLSSTNPTTIWTPQGGYGNYAAPPTNTGGTQPNISPYQAGVTSSYLDAGGQQQQAPTNPYQFATPEAAQRLAAMYGGQAFGDQLGGPGNGWSTPQQLIGINGMQGNLNPGLIANTLGKYGSDPGSYGQFEVQRDIAQNSGKPFVDNYNTWATSQPGWKPNPLLANSGPGYNMVSDGKGGFYNAAGMPAPNQAGPQGTPTSFTGANGLVTTGIMNPYGAPTGGGGVPAGRTPGQGGTMINGQWSDYTPANNTPPVGSTYYGQGGSQFTTNAQGGFDPQQQPQQPGVPPGKVLGRDGTISNGQWVDYTPSNNDPTGGGEDQPDYSKGTYINGQWSQFTNPNADQTTNQQTPVGTRMAGQNGSEFVWDGSNWQEGSAQGATGAQGNTPGIPRRPPNRSGNLAMQGVQAYENQQNQQYDQHQISTGQGQSSKPWRQTPEQDAEYRQLWQQHQDAGNHYGQFSQGNNGVGQGDGMGRLLQNHNQQSQGYGNYGGNTRTSSQMPTYPGAQSGYPSSTLGPTSARYSGSSGSKYLSY